MPTLKKILEDHIRNLLKLKTGACEGTGKSNEITRKSFVSMNQVSKNTDATTVDDHLQMLNHLQTYIITRISTDITNHCGNQNEGIANTIPKKHKRDLTLAVNYECRKQLKCRHLSSSTSVMHFRSIRF